MADWALETTHLSKTFRPPRSLRRPWHRPPAVTAVDNVNLQVARGELFGLLGPNGAGKTTLIKILCTLIAPDSGRARVMGRHLHQQEAIKRAVGLVVADERSFYWRLSVRHNLEFFATMQNLPKPQSGQRIDAVLEQVGLTAETGRRVSELSTGMRQRLAIARGLLHQPHLLFLDEPTRSLDPLAATQVHDLIRELAANGVTILLTSHHLSEAETLCQRVAVMHRGTIRACARPDVLRQMLTPTEHYRLELDRYDAQLTPTLAALAGHLRHEGTPGGRQWLDLDIEPGKGALTAVLDALRAASIEIVSIQSQPPTLEKVFVQLVEEQD